MSAEHVIVVGIDGSRAAWAALDWAGEHAALTGRALVIAHVGDTDATPGTVTQQSFGADLLEDAVATLAEARPEVPVTTRLLPGDPAQELVQLSATADIVAVGRGRRGLASFVLGSTADRVLRYAHCAIAVVPRGGHPTANVVGVGVSGTDGGRSALRFAFEEAARRHAELVAVRSWLAVDWSSDAPVPPMSDSDAWQEHERAALEDELRPLRSAFPELAVRAVVTHEPVEAALEREGHHVAMLVLGGRHSIEAHLPLVGSVTDWAVHHFDCPVVVMQGPRSKTEQDERAEATPAAAGGALRD